MSNILNILTEEFLKNEYSKKGRFAKDIAIEVGCSEATVGKYLKKYGIQTSNRYDKRPKFKGLNPARQVLTKEYLKLEYIDKCRSLTNIARELQCSPTLVREMVIKYGLTVNKNVDRSFYGEDNPATLGYICEDNDYLMVRMPNHPKADARGYVRLHILLAEHYNNIKITEDEVVHHINEDKQDNRKKNLQIMTKKEHDSLHSVKRWNRKKLK